MTATSRRLDERQVVPRWRDFRTAVGTGELASHSAPSADANDGEELVRLEAEFRATSGVFVAADLLGALLSNNARSSLLREVGEFLVNRDDAPLLARELAASAVDLYQDEDVSQVAAVREAAVASVARMRSALRAEPRNAIDWVNLSLGHATLGNNAASRRAMMTALDLAAENRFVLRSMTRLLVHLEEPRLAHDILSKSARTKTDPWLLSAQMSVGSIAFGDIRESRLARELLSSGNFSPKALSELASELATAEVNSGRDKRARLLFKQSLLDPTENSVAQAASLSRRADFALEVTDLEVARGFEARSIVDSLNSEWAAATQQAGLWYRDQPFSVEPLIFGSYTAALGGGDFETGLDFALTGLRTHPTDEMLNNNAAFALANLDRTEEARKHMIYAPDDEEEVNSYVNRATFGLIEFREGRYQAGRYLYQSAVEALVDEGRQDLGAMATALWAIEEKRIGSNVATELANLLERVPQSARSAELETLVERLTTTEPVIRLRSRQEPDRPSW